MTRTGASHRRQKLTPRRSGLVAWSVAPLVAAAIVSVACCGAPSNAAASAGVGWGLAARTFPAHLPRSSNGLITVDILNTGAEASLGSITVTDELPSGVTARGVEIEGEPHPGAGEIAGWGKQERPRLSDELWNCSGDGPGPPPGIEGAKRITCVNTSLLQTIPGGAGHPTNASNDFGPNYEPTLGIAIAVSPSAAEGSLTNHVSITGGGSSEPSATSNAVNVSSPSGAEIVGFDGWFSNTNGTNDLQAGSRPYAATFNLDLPVASSEGTLLPAGEARNITVDLPPGLVGNPTAVPQCTRQQFDSELCPDESQVGLLTAKFAPGPPVVQTVRVFNLVPPVGTPAEFGATVEKQNVLFDTAIRTGTDYGVVTRVRNSPQVGVVGSVLTLWGIPSDPTHDIWRSVRSEGGCSREEVEHRGENGCISSGEHPSLKPFLRLPTSCERTPEFSAEVSDWQTPSLVASARFPTHNSLGEAQGLTGCGALPFAPTIQIAPDVSTADSPTGLHVDLHLPQSEGVARVIASNGKIVGAEPSLATADLRDAVVTLPEGMSVNPSSANGLAACTPAEIGLTSAFGAAPAQYTAAPANCPSSAQIGSVEVDSPLVSHPLKGSVYVAEPYENPFSSLLAIYIAVHDPETGVVLKLAGHVEANAQTGQLTTRFDENPQLPFEDFKLVFFGGPGAALRTPPTCGAFTSTSELVPWSAPESASAFPASGFVIDASPVAASCPASEAQEAASASFEAGSASDAAGAYSPLVVKIARPDDSQTIGRINVLLPKGLVGNIAGIPYCPEASIRLAESKTGREEQNSPSCPAASEMGTVTVGAGAGSTPFYVTGHAYLSGPYDGAPFDLVVVTPAVAGPYDLGTVVVRTPLYVDPLTAQIHALSDPLPTLLKGIPLDVRSIVLNMNRHDFTLNPTDCEPLAVTGQLVSPLSITTSVASPFEVDGCNGLRFAPKFNVTTSGKTSRLDGTSLIAQIHYPVSAGQYTNIASAKVELPKQLPSRLETLHGACLAAVFNAGPQNCPAKSIVGQARVITPLLSVPLTGAAYFVSHGGEAFPSLTIVLKGDGITLDLVGSTLIRNGITSTTFRSTPDVPFSLFELRLPAGPHSALGAYGNLCTATLIMPTKFVAQNGLLYHAATHIGVAGCSRRHKKTPSHKAAKRGKKQT